MTDARRHCLVCGQGRRAAAAAALAVITAVAARAEALQPLQAFLQSAAKRTMWRMKIPPDDAATPGESSAVSDHNNAARVEPALGWRGSHARRQG